MKNYKIVLISTLILTTLFILNSCNKEEVAQNAQGDVAGRMTKVQDLKKAKEESAVPYTILMKSEDGCDASKYTALAVSNTSGDSNLAKEKDLGSYTLLNLLITEENIAKIDPSTDTCIEMAFKRSDKQSLKEMRTLLKEDMQKMLEEGGYGETVYDLPTNCEDLKENLSDKLSDSELEAVYQKCLEMQENKGSLYEQQQDDMYENTSAEACNAEPAIEGCSPSMTEEQYVKYAMDYITPDNETVNSTASKYTNIASMYKFMQQNHWQSDTTIFGCGDYFQKPESYLNTSPTLNSNMVCEDSAGDCDDQGNAFASMLIASGLYSADEVRVALGYVDFGSGVGGHLWTEVYMDGIWVPIDAVWGDTCYDNGKCFIYDANDANKDGYSEDDLISYDYFKYIDYPVVEYWGVANNENYCTYNADSKTWKCSEGAASYWGEGAKTVYDLQ